MSEKRRTNEQENGDWANSPHRSFLGCSVLLGAVVGIVVGVFGGLSGLMQMEYKAKPWEHAIMLGWSGGVYGLILGFVSGLALNALAKRRRRNESDENGSIAPRN
jgi:hypothetical protein